jgi:hypothetical protein
VPRGKYCERASTRGILSGSCFTENRFNSYFVVDGLLQSPFTTEIFFRSLHRDVAQQKFRHRRCGGGGHTIFEGSSSSARPLTFSLPTSFKA